MSSPVKSAKADQKNKIISDIVESHKDIDRTSLENVLEDLNSYLYKGLDDSTDGGNLFERHHLPDRLSKFLKGYRNFMQQKTETDNNIEEDLESGVISMHFLTQLRHSLDGGLKAAQAKAVVIEKEHPYTK